MKQSVENFLGLVRSSRLIDNDQLERSVAELQALNGGVPVSNVNQLAVHLVDKGLLTQWQSDRLLEGRHKGFFLGKYKLLDHLGTGGMSSVYLAEHVLMQRRRAIKVLPKNRVDDTSYLARFLREAQAAAALDDRNVVRAYDVDCEGDVHYLVMEYVEGSDLHVLVKEKGPLDYAMAADYIRQAARGLAHAHAIGLVHRDIKPANLLVDKEGTVKVLDLGLARFSDEGKGSLTVAYDENVLGTADYLAPEQALDSHGVDGRADIYSLGCTLFYLLTGHPPFDEGTLPQRIMAHQRDPVPDIRKERPDMPPDLMKICAKMMTKKPENRFQTAEQIVAILTRWLVFHGHEVKDADSSAPGSQHPPAARQSITTGRRGEQPPSSSRPGSSARGSTRGSARGSARGSTGGSARGSQPSRPGSRSGTPAETLSSMGRSTSKGRRQAGLSSSGTFRASPVGDVKPPAEAANLQQLEDPMQVSMEAERLPEFLADDQSAAMVRLRAQRASGGLADIPVWGWGLIGGGVLIAVIALLLFVLL